MAETMKCAKCLKTKNLLHGVKTKYYLGIIRQEYWCKDCMNKSDL